MITPQEVIGTFELCTGIRLRAVPHSVQRQAGDFVKHGFTLTDMELVVAWIKRQISHRKSGFTDASYTWRRMFGDHGAADEFLVFQERLGLAEQDRRRGWRPKLATEPAAPKPAAKAVAANEPQADPDSIRQAADEFWRKMGRKSPVRAAENELQFPMSESSTAKEMPPMKQ